MAAVFPSGQQPKGESRQSQLFRESGPKATVTPSGQQPNAVRSQVQFAKPSPRAGVIWSKQQPNSLFSQEQPCFFTAPINFIFIAHFQQRKILTSQVSSDLFDSMREVLTLTYVLLGTEGRCHLVRATTVFQSAARATREIRALSKGHIVRTASVG